jgi:hypothetical protein
MTRESREVSMDEQDQKERLYAFVTSKLAGVAREGLAAGLLRREVAILVVGRAVELLDEARRLDEAVNEAADPATVRH